MSHSHVLQLRHSDPSGGIQGVTEEPSRWNQLALSAVSVEIHCRHAGLPPDARAQAPGFPEPAALPGFGDPRAEVADDLGEARALPRVHGLAVFFCGPGGPAAGQERLVVADQVVLEHGKVVLGSPQVLVSEDLAAMWTAARR
jgi:hypothetical protein